MALLVVVEEPVMMGTLKINVFLHKSGSIYWLNVHNILWRGCLTGHFTNLLNVCHVLIHYVQDDWMNFLSLGVRVALPPHHLVVTLTALFAKV